MNGLPVTLRVKIDIIDEKLIGSFEFNRTGWSLAFGIDGNVGQVQVREGSLNLTKVVIEAIGERTAELG